MKIMDSNVAKQQSNIVKTTRGLFDIPLAAAGIVAASSIGAWITNSSIETGWYAILAKSELNPPSVVFGPVWTTLYVLLFIAFVLARKSSPTNVIDYKVVFGINLAINLLWSVVFFGYQSIVGGVIVILVYLASCIAMALVFKKYNSTAAWMIAPLIAWVSFASYLNFMVMRLN